MNNKCWCTLSELLKVYLDNFSYNVSVYGFLIVQPLMFI